MPTRRIPAVEFPIIRARFEAPNDPITDVERLPDRVGCRSGTPERATEMAWSPNCTFTCSFPVIRVAVFGERERNKKKLDLVDACVLADLTRRP